MKFFTLSFVYIALGLIFSSCGWFGESSDTEKSDKRLFGWQFAGLELPLSGEYRGGARFISNIGDDIFVMDNNEASWQIEPDDPYRWRIWKGKVGSMQWDSLPLPNNRFARCWTFLEGKMYVGAYNFPEVWEYNPVTNDWLQIDLPEVGNGVEHDFSVASLASFQGQLVVGIIDLSGAYNHEFWMGDIELGNWTDIPRVTTTFNTQAPLTKMVELNGWLYGIDGSVGVFRWQPGMDSLEQLKSPRNKPDEEIEDVSAIAVHNQQIIVGHSRYYDGVFRLTTDLEWEHMTPPKSNSALSDAPRDVLTILSYQGNLYMAGAVGAYVRIWDPADTDCLDFGDWKLISNIRCYDEGKCQNQFRTEHTPGLIGIGDTLYAASWEYVLKLPISDVEKLKMPIFTEETYENHESRCVSK